MESPSRLRFLPLAPALLALAGCNAITGIGSLTYEVPVEAQGVTIQDVAVYQGLKRSLGNDVPSAGGITVPLVAGRDAMVRVFVQTDATYDGSPVTANVYTGDDPAPIQVVSTAFPSVEDALDSTLNVDVPGARMTPGGKLRVELTQPNTHSPGGNAGARFPAQGDATLDTKQGGTVLHVRIVPVKYQADGSGRLPDTSEAQLQGYREWFRKTYPIPEVEISAREPWTWKYPIDPSGMGWDTVLEGVTKLRQDDIKAGLATDDIFYFGAFEPAASDGAYCSGGCVAGLAGLGSAADTYDRVAVGLGFTGEIAWTTAIHEIGHTQGRRHAPCGGPANVDPGFPYKDASIGAWGFDLVRRALIAPDMTKDMMGYCDPYWISDYTYKALFDGFVFVSSLDVRVPPELRDRTWERARVGAGGALTWLSSIELARPPVGEATPVKLELEGGTREVTGQFFAYDHLPGGVLLWPQEGSPARRVDVTVDGHAASLVSPGPQTAPDPRLPGSLER